MESVLRNVKLENHPYPWLHTEACLSDELYGRLEYSRPDMSWITKETYGNKRYDKGALEILHSNVPLIWKEFTHFHTSKEFWLEWCAKLGHIARFHYPWLEWAFRKRLEDLDVGIRGQTDKDIYLDCQLSVNTPTKEQSLVIGPHIDNPQELYGSLLYMRPKEDNSEGGNFRILDAGRPKIFNKREVANSHVWSEKSYERNTYVGFLNTPYSVHGVTERKPSEQPRLMVNISIEMCDKHKKLFNPEVYRG